MSANLVIHTNPYRVHLDVEEYKVAHDLTICQTLVDRKLVESTPTGIRRLTAFVVLLNGEPVLQADWNYVLRDEDTIQVAYLPRGGGGGSSIKNIITAIIIAVAAFFTFGLSLIAAAAVGAAALDVLSLTGTAVPPTSLSNPNDNRTSPTYSLSAQGNQARLLQAMPRIYGRMRTYPDLASQPYSEYQNNEQYLYQLFCVSLGEVTIENIFLDDTPISEFEDAQYEVIQPNGVVTLFPDNVVTSQAVGQLPMVGTNNSAWALLGPFNAVPVGQQANYLAVDIAFPQGAQTIDEKNNRSPRSIAIAFDYRLIDDQGNPLDSWRSLVGETLTFNTQEAQLITRKVQVPLGRYQVRGARASAESTDGSAFDATQWVGLRAYLQDTKVYGNCTLLAVIMKATNTLNSSTARKFSVLATGKVPKWDPVNGWSAPVATRNPIWAACDIIRNPDYGRGLGTDRINITRAYQIAQTCDTRGDTFNAVFDTTVQLWEALSKCLTVVRTVPMYYAGVIDFVRDEPQNVVKFAATPATMVMSSFKTTYNFFDSESPDHVVVEFINEETWQTEQVSCVLPGHPSLNPSTVQLFGCTDRQHAWREGMYLAACNLYRRRNITFASEKDGLIPRYFGLTRVLHDVPQWGFSGRCFNLDRVTGVLHTSEEIPFRSGVVNYVAFRRRDGSEDGPYQLAETPINNPDSGVFAVRLVANTTTLQQIYISNGQRDELTLYMAGPSEQRGLLCLVKSAMPDNEGKVNISLINYSEAVYAAESGGVLPAPPPDSNLPVTPTAPIVNSVNVVYTVDVGQQNIVVSPASGAIYYEYEAQSDGALNWQKLGMSANPTLMVYLSAGVWTIRVRAVGRAVGPWATWQGTIEATTLPVPRLDTFLASSQLFAIGLSWSYEASTANIAKNVEIWMGATNILGDATRIVNLPYPANAFTVSNLAAGERKYFWGRVIDTAGRTGPWFNSGASITQIATNDATKILNALDGKISQTQLSQELWEEIASAGGGATAIEEIRDQLSAAITLRAQVRGADGNLVISGVAIGVEPENGELVSQMLVLADRFAVLQNVNGTPKSMFVVENNEVYMNAAFIQQATITNALIGATLESVAKLPNNEPILSLNFQTGAIKFNGTGAGGSLTINNQLIQVRDTNGILRLRMGVWA